ncbi:hypothetical protein G5V59_11230 [Nocardioides sp. W3-2-3]|uniref:hypothetical protein n=1 Tax=Nocardioides convexus TaxID=2712224 RepID=UPI0024181B05|nr:hypothetical protein [Nocardioides convexus]NHA00439.1 hypothetical protein [Nocardioides convexus]
MRAAGEPVPGMPEEFTGPVGYADRWLWIAVALPVLVVLYYLAAWWFTRRPRPSVVTAAVVDVPDVRRAHLARIDALAEDVHSGRTTPRVGHQQPERPGPLLRRRGDHAARPHHDARRPAAAGPGGAWSRRSP